MQLYCLYVCMHCMDNGAHVAQTTIIIIMIRVQYFLIQINIGTKWERQR